MVATLAGCAAPSPVTAPAPVAAADPCVVSGPHDASPAVVRVALLDEVRARAAPTPTSDAERLVFRQLYEQLVRVDCTDSVRPALAREWSATDGGRRWTFRLRTGPRFWDGTPVDASALREAWRADSALPVVDVHQVDATTIAVVLHAPRALQAFADPGWSVVKRIAESAWPLGTGPVWVDAWTVADGDSVLRARPVPHAAPGAPTIEFRRGRAADPRDLLDRDLDVLVTRDPAVRRYAEDRAGWTTVPLPWDRLYGLISPRRRHAANPAQLDRSQQTALARDAVRADARAPLTPPWWDETPCGAGVRRPATTSPRYAVAFPQDDPVARDLAGRLVARADAELAELTGGAAAGVRSVALEPMMWAATLRSGTDLALVLPLPRRPLDPCRAVAALVDAAPWLADPGGAVSAAAVAPLVETRASAVLRHGIGARVDGDGTIRLVPGGEGRP